MRALRFALLALLRDWRSGELAVLLAALLVAVTALTGVGFFTDRISQAVAQRAAEVLAADLRLRSLQPVGPEYEQLAAERGIATARTIFFPSVVFFGEDSALAAIRAVGPGYPLRGKLKISDAAFSAARETDELPGRGEVWLDPRLLARLGASVGDQVNVGAATFTVSRVLDYRPDQGANFVDLAPSLLLPLADLDSTELLGPGSRATYSVLFAGTPAAIADFKAELADRKTASERLVDIAEESPQVEASSERAGRFLNLSAMITVLLAAVAVAMAARRYTQRHLDNVALMKCMGAPQRLVLQVTIIELALLAVIAAIVGAVLGFAAQEILAWLLGDLVRADLPPPTTAPAIMGAVTALAILVGFALPPMLQLKRVPPARVLRRNLEPPKLRYTVSYGLAVAALLAVLFWLVRDAKLVAFVAGGIAATLAILYLAGFLLVRLTGRLRGAVGVAWRYGLANLARRGRESVVQVVAFGLGLMVLLLLAVVRNDLLEDWRASLPADTPNFFMINIPADETEQFAAFIEERGLPKPVLFPMIRARMTALNGTPVDELKLGTDRGRGFAEREQNLSWAAQPQVDNRIVAGEWWTESDYGKALVSVATDYQEEMGLMLGDKLTFDVAGETLEAEVTSFRQVEWDNFRPNFFLVFPPRTLDGLAGTWLTSMKLSEEQRGMLVDVVRRFPSVSLFDIDAILAQVRDVMNRASLAVQYVFLFTLAAGITVLLAAIQATRDERRYESAMLRTLGARRRVVLAGVASEFTALGMLSGVLAAVGATLVGWLLATQVFELEYAIDPWVWVIGLVAGAVIVGGAGTFAARKVVNHPPISTLREG
ncbi:MAG TPA: FtsX-like permease family protein [Steroidobacteraceae bacterium]|nr:FtsX-like permease family protein [Steroidobacteraceae bacterium]